MTTQNQDEKHEAIKEKLVKIVGQDNVIEDPMPMKEYLKDYSFIEKQLPDFLVFVNKDEEVQQIVELANRFSIPLTPRSSNISFYGEGIPSLGGIVINFSRMNKLLKIDVRNKAIRVEPGLTWENLQEELKKHQVRICNPLLPHPRKSVLTTYLERFPALIPKYEYAEQLTTTKVVLFDGRIFGTGSAAGPGHPDKVARPCVQPQGPGNIDFHRIFQGSQGSFSLVLWGTLKVEPLPVKEKLFFISIENLKDAIEPIYQIQRRMIGYESFLINNLNFAIILAQNWPEDFQSLREKLPPWTLLLCLGGLERYPDEKIEYEEEALMAIAENLKIKPSTTLSGFPGLEERVFHLLKGPWNEEVHWKHRFKGNCCDLFFLTTLNRAPEFGDAIIKNISKTGISTTDIGCYLQPLEYGRACHLEYNIFYDINNSEEYQLVKSMYNQLSEIIYSMGGYFARPYGKWGDLIYKKAPIYTNSLKKVKEILDPSNIFNPGRF